MSFDLVKIIEAYEDELPEQIADMAKLIPVVSVAKLVDEFGGQNLYVPEKAEPDTKIGKILSKSDMAKLCKEYPGNIIPIPRLMDIRRLARNLHIVKAKAKGMRIHKIASDFDLTSRQIHNILAQEKAKNTHE